MLVYKCSFPRNNLAGYRRSDPLYVGAFGLYWNSILTGKSDAETVIIYIGLGIVQ